MDVEKFKDLLNDLEDLSSKDGYGACWCEHCDDSICATSQFFSYKELAKKYGVDYKKYGMDKYEDDELYEEKTNLWDNGDCLSYEIKQIIMNEIMNIVGE